MDKNRCPRSLVAYAAEEVAKAYKFASQDAFSFVRNIDYHPINTEGLSAGYDIISDKKIKLFDKMEKDRFFITLNRFLINRRQVMKEMLNNLAKMVVNFTNREEVKEKNLKEIRAQYVASYKAQDELETIGIKLRLENNIEKLLSQIQQERTRAKLMNLFVNQSYLKYGDTVEDVDLDLGNHFPICTKTGESVNDLKSSTCAGTVTEDIYAEVGYNTALERGTSLYNVARDKNDQGEMKHCFQDDGFGFQVKAERALDTQDAKTERDGLLLGDTRVAESAEGVLTADKITIKSKMEEDSKRERSKNSPDKDKSNEKLEKCAIQHENRVARITKEGIINHEVESEMNETLMDNTHIVTVTNIGIKGMGRLIEVSNVALENDKGEGKDIDTKKILDIASDEGWSDDEENDDDNFVLYGMMNYEGKDIDTKKILDIASENGCTDDEENDDDNFVLYGMMNYRTD